MEEAKEEGQLAIYGSGGKEKVYVEAFQRANPGIRVIYTPGRSSSLVSRIMAERRSGKYLLDLMIGATKIPLSTLKPAGVLEPIRPLLILPEVLDTSAWFNNKIWFGDYEEKYVVMWQGGIQAPFAINTNLTKPREFNTYWDLLKSKWKGKISAQDPRTPGSGQNITYFMYATPSLGPKFLKRLFGEMDVKFARDKYQLVKWLAKGKNAINLFTQVDLKDIKAGLPVAMVDVEGPAPVSSGGGTAAFLTHAPHPNAARVFINWLLTREGQIAFQRVTGSNSMRNDISKKAVANPGSILKEGRKYFITSMEKNVEQMGKEFRYVF